MFFSGFQASQAQKDVQGWLHWEMESLGSIAKAKLCGPAPSEREGMLELETSRRDIAGK